MSTFTENGRRNAARGDRSAPRPALELIDVRVGYGKTPVVEALSLRVESGEFLLLQGENGAGKSTILKTILGLLRPTAGEVHVLGRSLTGVGAASRARAVRRRIGYLSQVHDPPALPMTVSEAVLLGRWGSSFGGIKRPGASDRRAAARALEQVGMSELAGRDVRTLSGGQRQRVALAGALSREPALLLMDEPTTHLDVEAQADLGRRIVALNREHGISVLLVSHGSFAESAAGRVVRLAGGRVAADRIDTEPAPADAEAGAGDAEAGATDPGAGATDPGAGDAEAGAGDADPGAAAADPGAGERTEGEP